MIIDTIRAIFPLAQGEGSTPVAPLNCDTSRRQSLSRRIRYRTANGEILRKGTLTAAHRRITVGTIVRVINLENGRSVNVRINDRGPFKYHRVIDLAHGAASELKMMRAG